MTATAGVNYCYDNNGNQTRRNGSNCTTGGDTFGWDGLNDLTSFTPASGTATTYSYNGDGVRTKKTTGTTITEYYQDVAGGLPRVAADKTDTVWNYYVYGTSLIGKVGSDNVARYYHYDGTGHVRAITDSTGAVVERYDYDAFGSLRNTPTGLANDRRFTGEQYDAETAYTFLRARYYDPVLGRFISKDSFKGVKNDPQSLNRYAYVGNNPVNRSDPSGKCWCLVLAAPLGPAGFVAAAAMAAFTTYVMNETGASQAIAKWADATWDDLSTMWAERRTEPFTPDQGAVVELAKNAEAVGRPLTAEEAEALLEWGEETGLENVRDDRGEDHWKEGPHIHIGPVNHIPTEPLP